MFLWCHENVSHLAPNNAQATTKAINPRRMTLPQATRNFIQSFKYLGVLSLMSYLSPFVGINFLWLWFVSSSQCFLHRLVFLDVDHVDHALELELVAVGYLRLG